MLKVLGYVELVCLFSVLLIAVYQDIKTRKIKNVLTVSGIAIGLVFSLIMPERTFVDALLGFLLIQVLGIILWKLKIFRAGDAKLLCVTGTFLGWKMGLNILLISSICGAVFGIPLVVKRLMKKEKQLTRFPFSIAVLVATVIGIGVGYLWEMLPGL